MYGRIAVPCCLPARAYAWLTGVVAAALTGVANAQSLGVEPHQLAPVVVTATRSERSVADVPLSATVVEREQILNTPAQSLDDVLRTVPSLNVPNLAAYQQHPTANSVSMRGLGGIRALVLLDGVPLNDPFFGYVQWSQVPMETIDRVEVVRGGGSNLWGTYAMGGVVNIITRPPETTELAGDAGYGSYRTYRLNGYGALASNEVLKLSANVNYFNTAGYNQVVPDQRGPIYVPTAFDAVNAQLTGNFKVSPNLSGFLRVNYYDNDQTLITPLSTNAQRTWNVAGGMTGKLPGGSSLTGTVFYTNDRFRTDNTATPSGVPVGYGEFVSNIHNTPTTDFGASLVWSTRVNEYLPLVSFGADYRLIDGEDVANIYDETGVQIRTDIGRGKQQFAGGFAQASVFPVPALEILASVRYQYWKNFDGFLSLPGFTGNVPDKTATNWSPRLSLRYEVVPQFALRAAAYEAFRAPNLDNLYRAFSTPFGIFLPNPALKPETLTGWEVGFDVQAGSVRSQVTYYDNTVKDLITSRNLDFTELPGGFFFGTVNINAGEAHVRGVEATLNWAFAKGWNAILGYNYADSQITSNPLDPTTVGNQQGGVPRNQASVGASYSQPLGWQFLARWRWVEKFFSDNAQTLPVDQASVVDVSGAYRFSRRVEVFANIQNLFNYKYVADNSGFNPPLLGLPFSLFAGVRGRFD
ncbi:MAG TPA: TonB-dependent receptor [Burkholderiales bacterium]|nr:TonB-dependent receptor [Burkholderiales bacterium]